MPSYSNFSIEKTDSAQYHTVRRLTLRSMILRRDSEKFEYLSENETKIKNILTQWSVTQAGSNDDKNWRPKISLDCPFKGTVSQDWRKLLILSLGICYTFNTHFLCDIFLIEVLFLNDVFVILSFLYFIFYKFLLLIFERNSAIQMTVFTV